MTTAASLRRGRHVARSWGRAALPVMTWALFAGFVYLIFSGFNEGPFVTWGFALKELLSTMAGYYFFSAVILPRWLLRRRWLQTALGLAAIYFGWALLSYVFFLLLDYRGPVTAGIDEYIRPVLARGLWGGVFSWFGVSRGISDFSATVLPPLLLRFVLFLLASSNRSLQLERENLNLEVNFLKAQINPHFLFNTLNNIYTMVVKQDVRVPAMVQHLADLMHYTVYESNAAQVLLSREIEFLEAYLELERLRYGKKVTIAYQQTGPADQYRITPLLLFPFIENAFKHGVDSSLEASWVTITLAVSEAQLRFAVSNSCPPAGPRAAFSGVGIANVSKRLALHYPAPDYELTIDQDAGAYRVALAVRLLPA